MAAPYVLCYHAVSSVWPARLAIPEALLAEQLGTLARRGYEGLTLAEAERRRTTGTLPQRSVVVTFDDGYESTARARPILDDLGFPGTVFAVTSFPDSGRALSWAGVDQWATGDWSGEMTPLGWDGLEALKEAGWEIGSHTVTHPKLPEASGERLAEELGASRETIIARLGSCETIAYPYGLADERVAAAAGRAGYLAGVTLTPAHRADEPLLRPPDRPEPEGHGVASEDEALTGLRRVPSDDARAWRRMGKSPPSPSLIPPPDDGSEVDRKPWRRRMTTETHRLSRPCSPTRSDQPSTVSTR